MTKTLWKSNWVEDMLSWDKEKPKMPVQLELGLEHTCCVHKFVDDGEEFCRRCIKCGYYSEVSFVDEWDGKTYQEIYEMIQRDRGLKF